MEQWMEVQMPWSPWRGRVGDHVSLCACAGSRWAPRDGTAGLGVAPSALHPGTSGSWTSCPVSERL